MKWLPIQINCAAIAHLQTYLPRTGILYVFIIDQEEMWPKVLYFDGDCNELQSAKDLEIAEDYSNPGFCFWDAGEIYFVIHKSDLDKKDFSNVYCGLKSS